MTTPTDGLDSALAFVLQSARRLWDAERNERLVDHVRAPRGVVQSAEDATRAAALTLDAATDEYNQQIRDHVKATVMEAVAAMQPEPMKASV